MFELEEQFARFVAAIQTGIAPAATGEDGRWSAPDARGLYFHARTAGFVYQASLRASLVESLGVSFGPVRHGAADLAGIDATVLFNGFEMDRFVATPRERGDDTVLLVLGRHEERKGIAHAINAVRSHNAKDEDTWRLIVLGDGPQATAHELRQMSASGLFSMVFIGAISTCVDCAHAGRAFSGDRSPAI